MKKELEEKRLKEEAEKEAAKAKESIEASLQVEPKDANDKVPEASTEVFIIFFFFGYFDILILLHFKI